MALLCNCGSEDSLQLVLVGRIFLFGGFRCVYIYICLSCFDLLVYLCVFYSCSAYSVSVSQVFLRFASLCSDRTVLSICMGHSGGDRYFVCIVHSRWNEVA